MKKIICKILAFIMILGAASFDRSGVFTNIAQAAGDHPNTGPFIFRSDYTLKLAPNMQVDKSGRNAGNFNEVVLAWPSDEDVMKNGVYTLTYAIDDGYFMSVDFEMGEVITVHYRIITKDTSGNPSYRPLLSIPAGSTGRTAIDGIRNVTSQGDARIYNTDVPAEFDLVSTDPANPVLIDPNTITCKLYRGGGVAFKIVREDNLTVIDNVKIFWSDTADLNNGRKPLYFSTDRAAQSEKIYPFTLKGAIIKNYPLDYNYSLLNLSYPDPMNSANTITEIGRTLAISTGYKINSASRTALSREFVPTNPARDYLDRDGAYVLDYVYPIEHPSIPPISEYQPATNPGIAFDFPLPLKWNASKLAFETVTEDDNITLSFGNLGEKPISVLNGKNVYTATPYVNSDVTVKYTQTGATGKLEITGLPASVVYNDSIDANIQVDSVGGSTFGPYGKRDGSYNTVIGSPMSHATFSLYTYLKYSYQQVDAKNYEILLTPYKTSKDAANNVYGTYVLYRLLGPRAEAVKPSPLATINVAQGINDKAGQLHIPINFEQTANPAYHYRIDFVESGTGTSRTLSSQTIYFEPEKVVDTLSAPKEFTITNVKTITVEDPKFNLNGGEQDYVRFKVSFVTGLNEIFINMSDTARKGVKEVEYVLSYGKIPGTSDPYGFLTLVVPLDSNFDPTGPASAIVKTEDIYISDGTKRDPEPPAPNDKKADNLSNGMRLLNATYSAVTLQGSQDLYGIIEAEMLAPIAPTANPSKTHFPYIGSDPYLLLYPNVYYISVNGVYSYKEPSGTEISLARTVSSNEAQLNVGEPAKMEVPAPGALTAKAAGTNSIDFSWRISGADLFEYMDYILNPKKRTFAGILTAPNATETAANEDTASGVSVKYNMYFGRDFERIKSIADGSGTSFTFKNVDAGDASNYDGEGRLNVSKFDFDSAKYLDANDFMRDGGIYFINSIEQSDFSPEDSFRSTAYFNKVLTIAGLDDNTPYYAIAYTELYPFETEWKDATINGVGVPKYVLSVVGKRDTRHPIIVNDTPETENVVSGFTAAVTATTQVSTDDPKPDEYEPPAPTGLTKDYVTSTSADILWNVIPENSLPANIRDSDDYEIQYDVVRVKDDLLPDSFATDKRSISSIKAGYGADYLLAAWETENPPANLKELTGSQPGKPDVPYEKTQTQHVFMDGTLVPGTMYVYYVRTVLMDDAANPLKYSVWVPVSVTTAPIDGPINLRTLRSGQYDKYTEALIAFDAPAKMDDIVNKKYALLYSIKPDSGDWGSEITMELGNLMDGITPLTDPQGFYSFQYKITGLEPGSTYTFRVRIMDLETGDKSMWSNAVQHRTEFDPDKPEDPVPKWEEYFKEKMQELLKRPYWPINDKSGSAFEAIYRASMIDGEIGGAPEGVLTLGKDARSQIYYIPAQAYQKLNAANESLKISAENVTLTIPPEVINSMDTQSLKDIIGRQNDKKIKDYYIRFSLALSGTNESINGNSALTDRIDVSVKTVGFTEMERIWDLEMEAELKLLMTDDTVLNKARNRLSKALSDGYSNQEMVLLVETLVAEVDQQFLEIVKKSFNDTRQYEYDTVQLAKPVRLSAVPSAQQQVGATNIMGYRYSEGSWQALPTTPYGSGRSVLPVNPGTFIFSGATIYIPGIENMQGGDAVTNLVLKYGLDDFFGKGTSFNTSIPLSNDALIGTVARMAGARNTQDAATFLREKGVTVSTRNAYSAATNEATVYMLMSLYEIKTNTKVSSIKITNQNILKDIKGVNATYAPHYKAAYTMGIMDKNYQPKEQMSVKDFLTILGKLAGKINL